MSTLKVGTIQDHTNSNTAISIDSSGRVTTPARPAFHTNAKPASVSNGATVIWTSTLFNISSSYSTSTGKFTAPITGIYQFNVNLFFTSFNPAQIRIFKTPAGGSDETLAEQKAQGFAGSHHVLNDSRCIQLNVGDAVRVHKDSGTLTTNTGKDFGSFSGFLIG